MTLTPHTFTVRIRDQYDLDETYTVTTAYGVGDAELLGLEAFDLDHGDHEHWPNPFTIETEQVDE